MAEALLNDERSRAQTPARPERPHWRRKV